MPGSAEISSNFSGNRTDERREFLTYFWMGTSWELVPPTVGDLLRGFLQIADARVVAKPFHNLWIWPTGRGGAQRDPYAIWVSDHAATDAGETVIPFGTSGGELPTIEAAAPPRRRPNPQVVGRAWLLPAVRNLYKARSKSPTVGGTSSTSPTKNKVRTGALVSDFPKVEDILALPALGVTPPARFAASPQTRRGLFSTGNVIRVLTRIFCASPKIRKKRN